MWRVSTHLICRLLGIRRLHEGHRGWLGRAVGGLAVVLGWLGLPLRRHDVQDPCPLHDRAKSSSVRALSVAGARYMLVGAMSCHLSSVHDSAVRIVGKPCFLVMTPLQCSRRAINVPARVCLASMAVRVPRSHALSLRLPSFVLAPCTEWPLQQTCLRFA